MKRLNHRRTRALPMMVTELVLASWETVARRTAMIARGACTPIGISADDHRKSGGIAGIHDGDDDRARKKGGARAVAQARQGQCAAAATEDLSDQLPGVANFNASASW